MEIASLELVLLVSLANWSHKKDWEKVSSVQEKMRRRTAMVAVLIGNH